MPFTSAPGIAFVVLSLDRMQHPRHPGISSTGGLSARYRTVSPSAWPIMLSLLEGASIYEFIVRLLAQEMFCSRGGFFIDGLIIGRNHTIRKAAK